MTDGGLATEDWIPYLWDLRRADPDDMETVARLARALEAAGQLPGAAAQFAACGDDEGRARVLAALDAQGEVAARWR